MKKILVFGLFETSPGKTVVSTTLSRGIRNEGLRVTPFKPRSGHNLWYQHGSYDTCKKMESLFCEDIIKLRKAAKCNLLYEVLNPVDALMAPTDAGIYLSNNNIRRLYIDADNTFNNLIIERYTSCKNESLKYVLCLNKNQLNNTFFERDFINKLISKADKVVEVSNFDEWCSVSQRFGPKSISNCFTRISGTCDVVVVEGFNDAVCPAPGLVYDVVIGVGPGISAFYDPLDFQRALDAFSTMGHNCMTLRSRDVIKYIKTVETQPIQAIEMNYLEKYDLMCEKLKNILDANLKRLKNNIKIYYNEYILLKIQYFIYMKDKKYKIISYHSIHYEVLSSNTFNIDFLFFLFVIGIFNIEKIHQNQYYYRTGGHYFFEQHK